MRKFDLRLNGQALAWSLSIEDAKRQLDKLFEERYELWDKNTGEMAYVCLPGYRAVDMYSVQDAKSGHYIHFSNLILHEHFHYG